MREFDSSYEQELHLLQCFITYSMSSQFTRALAYKHFFGDRIGIFSRYSKMQMVLEHCSIILMPSIIFGILLYIFLQGVYMGAGVTTIWMYNVVIALILDCFVLRPLKIWINWVATASIVSVDCRACLGILRDRSKFILTRSQGMMSSANDLIQHVNPACRAARYFPHLSISRLLMSLNDFDVPLEYAVPFKTMRNRIEEGVLMIFLIMMIV
jgi:hypothetical protein